MFMDDVKVQFKKNALEHLKSTKIVKLFNTDTVYDTLDQLYIQQADINQYEKYINYVNDPVQIFEEYVDNLK